MTNKGTEAPDGEHSTDAEELSEEAASLVSAVRADLNDERAGELVRTKNAILGRVLAQGEDESSTNSLDGLPPGIGLMRPVKSKA